MGGISDYFSDENSFFDRYILNAPILSASYFNVTRDELISCLTTGKVFQADPPEGFTDYAESFCPGIKDQDPATCDQLLKAAALVGNKETQIKFLRHFSLQGMKELYESGHNEYYLVYDMLTPKVTYFVLTQLVLMKDMNSGDLVASFMTKDISRLKHFRKVATMAVNSICDCIAVIDTLDGSVTFESVSGSLMRVMPELGVQKKLDYDKTFVGIISAMAKPGADGPLANKISTEAITRELSEKDEYITVFDLETKPGEISRKQVMFQWFDNSHRYMSRRLTARRSTSSTSLTAISTSNSEETRLRAFPTRTRARSRSAKDSIRRAACCSFSILQTLSISTTRLAEMSATCCSTSSRT